MKNKYKNLWQGKVPGILAILLILVTGWGAGLSAQSYVNIGTASGNTNGTGPDPVCDYYVNLKYQTVYSAAEITAAGGAAGLIERLAWTITQDPGTLTNYQVTLAHYTTAAIVGGTIRTAASPGMSNWTVVKTAFSNTAAVGTNDITFDTPFNWDGTSNLFVEVCTSGNPYASPYGGVSIYTSAANSSRSIRSDGTVMCGAPLTGSSNTNMATKPIVRLFMQTAGCLAPSGLAAANTPPSSTAALSWGAVAGAAGYEYVAGPSPLAAPSGAGTAVATNSVNYTMPTALSSYQYYVRTNCGGGVFSSWAGPFTFSSGCYGATCNYVFNLFDSYGDGWNGASVTVRQNSVVTDAVTFTSGASASLNVSMCSGSSVSLQWTAGTWPTECSMTINDAFGNFVYSFATGGAPANGATFTTFTSDCTPPACAPPGSPTATASGPSTALVSWPAASPAPANGYDLYISPSATPAPVPATAPTVNNNVPTSYSLALASGQTRYIWIRSDCGATSSWVGPFAYTQPPPNDLCANAIGLTCNTTVSGTNIGATSTGAGGTCTTAPGAYGVWYSWTAGSADDVSLTTCNAGTDFDTKINVYSGTCGALACVIGNDDDCSSTFGPSTVNFTATVGVTYYVYVTGWNTSAGNFDLDMNCVAPAPPPANDDCATPTSINQFAVCVPTSGTTIGATLSAAPATPSCSFNPADDDVWYSFVATTATVNVQVQGLAAFDAVIAAYSGVDACTGTELACADNTFNGGQENLSLNGLTVGVTYYVRVFSYSTGNGAKGDFTICVFNGVDPCSAITPITCGSVNSYSESGAGVYSVTNCWFAGTPGKEKIFSFTPTVSGNYQFEVTSATGGFVDYFYKAAAGGCNGTGWTCILDIGNPGYYEFGPLTAGTPYYFLLDGEGTGAYNHTFRLVCPPSNDNCGNPSATLLTMGASCTPTSGSTQGANPSVIQTTLTPAADYPDVWYRFVSTGTKAQVKVVTSSLLLAGVEVYAACGDATPLCVEYAQGQGDDLTLTVDPLTSGGTYYIRVIDQLSGSLGLNYSTYFFTICVTTVPAPPATCVVAPPSANAEAEACGDADNNGCAAAGADIIMTNGSATTSLANFYDPGGVLGNYPLSQSWVMTINPTNPANKMRITWTNFSVESSWDGLYVHNGATTGSPLFASANAAANACNTVAGAYWGTSTPPVMTSTDASGALTFSFCSDGSVNNPGWAALLEEVDGFGVPVAGSSFESYSIGSFVSGSVYAECGTRDLDVYEFNVAQVTAVSFNVTAEFPVIAAILDANCPSTVRAINSTAVDCEQAQATTVLLPGNYRLLVAPQSFNGISCSSPRNNYFMQLVEALPPPNDDCAAAQSISVGVAGTCPSNQVTGNTLAALEEAIPDPTCNTGNISDVWYTFNSGVANELEVNLEYLSATMIGVELYTSCGALVSGSCILDAGAVSPITYAVTPYTQYRLRCFTNYDNQNPGTFRLCVQHKPQPPLNDNICGAFNIAVSSNSASETNGDNFYATQSPQAVMSCQTSHSRDVWYKATVPASGVVTVNTNYGTALDLVGAMYTSSDNTCTGTLTQVACDDDRGPLDAAWMQANNLTPGTIVFIRIAGFGAFPASTNKGTFKINVTEGLVWTGASDNTFNTISDPDLGIPTNWYSYDGGSYGPNNFSNAAVSIIIPLTAVNQPSAVGVVNCNSVRAVGNVFNVGGITAQAGATVNIHGNMSTNTLGTPRFTGAGQFRFNSTVATTHNILNNVRFFTTVTVAPTSTVAAGGKMIFEDNSSLFADSPAATYGAVTGSIKYRRTGNPSQYAYNYWSSPVQSATISSLIAPGVNPNTYQYETSNSTGVDYDGTQAGWLAVTPASVMQSGRGYIATGAGTATFTGVPTQSDVTYTATTGGGNFFNLVGNPFPAQLNAALFLSNNSGKITGGSIYVWDDDATGGVDYTAGDYIVSNGSITLNGPNSGAPFSGSIGACQGFFINWSGSGATINFNRSARILTGTNSEFFEATDYARLKLRIENNNEQSSETALLFAADATDAADVNYDAVRLPGNPALGVYTFIAGGEYVIQGLPELSTERIIPIGVVNTVAGPASIQMNQFEFFEEGVFVYLEDMQEGVFHNLANGPYAYTNTSMTSNDPIRFRLHLKAPLAVSVTAACAGQSSGKMIVNNPNQTAVTVNLKDAQNNTIATTGAFLGERVIENLTTGAYVLDFAYDNGDNATKAVQVGTGSIVAPASFVSSSTSVSIEDAIIEFQASAAGATEYVWNFGDGTTVSNDLNPVHAYMAPGVYTVTFTASNGGCESVATSVVSVSANTTGISSVENANGFTIYPNPAKNTANLLLNLDRSETQVKVSIHDAAGRLVKTQNVNNVRAGSIVELGINGLASGLYQVTVEGNSFRNVSRLTISK